MFKTRKFQISCFAKTFVEGSEHCSIGHVRERSRLGGLREDSFRKRQSQHRLCVLIAPFGRTHICGTRLALRSQQGNVFPRARRKSSLSHRKTLESRRLCIVKEKWMVMRGSSLGMAQKIYFDTHLQQSFLLYRCGVGVEEECYPFRIKEAEELQHGSSTKFNLRRRSFSFLALYLRAKLKARACCSIILNK